MNVVKSRITFDDYVECLENSKDKTIQQKLLRSDKHIIFTTVQDKIGLSSTDDKCYLLLDTFETLAWRHYSIMDVDN